MPAPHLQEDISDLFAYLEEWVQRTAISTYPLSIEIIFLERGDLPTAPVKTSRHRMK